MVKHRKGRVTRVGGAGLLYAERAHVRLSSIDFLRGLVIVIMALDHVREWFTAANFEPTDINETNAAYFFTRWITHFCAPVFILLAGTGAGLSLQKRRLRRDLSWFLLTRGAWLVVVEIVVMNWIFFFQLIPPFYVLQVIWAIGVSMIVLAGLIHLPRTAIITISVIMIMGHNLLDFVGAAAGSPAEIVASGGSQSLLSSFWAILHAPGPIEIGGVKFVVAYPLIPWIGVMALGFVLADLYQMQAGQRFNFILRTGLVLTATFTFLRLLNGYGDPAPWSEQENFLMTLVSYLNVTKYPPSFLFLLMTLGPALIVLALAERWRGGLYRIFVTFGRAPLFFYVAHWLIAHTASIIVGMAHGNDASAFLTLYFFYPREYGLGLSGVYIAWALIVIALYPACAWWAGVKKRNTSAVFSYL